jgi:hypothetical protein
MVKTGLGLWVLFGRMLFLIVNAKNNFPLGIKAPFA